MMQWNKILITGGAGFIGSNFVRLMNRKYPTLNMVILDKLTYAGNMDNLGELVQKSNIEFIKGDICDFNTVREAMKECDTVVNFAAETHVDRSIHECAPFIKTNYFGTYTLLEIAREMDIQLYVQISTDEVYGPIVEGSFSENAPLNPSNPYAATKAGADILCLSYFKTYRLPVCITRSTNNYGPYQYPEKLIPLFVINAIQNRPLPIYGDGQYIRDWVYVEDNCDAIALILEQGTPGEIYNVGANNFAENNHIARLILEQLGRDQELVAHVKDRPAHDKRYALDWSRIAELGWHPRVEFNQGFVNTVNWYRENDWWWMKSKNQEENLG